MKPEHFQTENNICVTVKGSFNGCYFIPYKYNSILPPKTDYIKAKSGHAGGLTVDFLSPTSVVLRFDNVDMWKVNMSNIKYVIDSNDYYSHVESLYPVVRYIFPFDTYIHPSIAERKNDSTYIFFIYERLASAIGNGGLEDIGSVNGTGLADKRMERDSLLRRVMEPYPLRINRNRLDTLYSMTYHKSHFTY